MAVPQPSPAFQAFLEQVLAGNGKTLFLLRFQQPPRLTGDDPEYLLVVLERLARELATDSTRSAPLKFLLGTIGEVSNASVLDRLKGIHDTLAAIEGEPAAETRRDVYRVLGRGRSAESVTVLLDLMAARPADPAWDDTWSYLLPQSLPPAHEARAALFPRLETLRPEPAQFATLVSIGNALGAPHVLAHRLEEIVRLAQDADEDRRKGALAALGLCGPEAQGHLSLLASKANGALRVAAATALARLGDKDGLKLLVAACADPIVRWRAVASLNELGESGLIPAAARDQAIVREDEVRRWLEFPTELGRAPDEVVLVDARLRRFAGGLLPKRHRLYRWTAGEATGTVMQAPVLFGLSARHEDGVEQVYAAYDAWWKKQKEQRQRRT